MASRGSDSGGVAGVFGVLILIWVVITYYWIIIGVGVAIGLFFAVRALIRREQERRLAAARDAEILAHRADRQHRWAQLGDGRGIYGVEGAELMRSISSLPTPPGETPGEDETFAAIALTAEDLDVLLDKKPRAWPWAVFVSVLLQRLANVKPRLRDIDLRYTAMPARYARNGREVAGLVGDCMDDFYEVAGRLELFMQSPAFMGVFGDGDDDSTADADGIVHVANRLMDFHERFVVLAERCRDANVPAAYTGLLQDCSMLMDIPLDGFRVFIDELVHLVEEMPSVLRYAPGDVDFGSITLEMVADERLIKRIAKQVRAAAKS
nr:hypothetical protein [Mycolicibacterium malmesburyense]CRL68176.1 hypothetical protein CPGR_00765 [Mycolicibacterium malmesburyense]